MARTKKATSVSKGRSAANQKIEDAVVIETKPAPAPPSPKPKPKPAAVSAAKAAEPAKPAPKPAPKTEAEAVKPGPKAEAPKPAPPPSEPEPAPARDLRGVLAGGLGGAVVMALGLGGFWALSPGAGSPEMATGSDQVAPLAAAIDAQTARLDQLQAELAEISATPVSGNGFEARVGALEADLAARLEELTGAVERLETSLAVFEGRLAQVEARPPVFEGDAAEVTGELVADMRAALEAQRDEVAALADDARARIAAAEAEAAALQERATTTSKDGMARAALSRLFAALDAGGPFAAPLGDIAATTGLALPEALTERAEAGVATHAALVESFPEAARTALVAARPDEAEGSLMERIGAFFKAQTGARSVVPREGDDADAVLSRAEAALRIGQVTEAIKLIEQLPEPGREAMATWRAEAEARVAAMAAAAELARAVAAE